MGFARQKSKRILSLPASGEIAAATRHLKEPPIRSEYSLREILLMMSISGAFGSEVAAGPERDAAEFMAELREQCPETYSTWLQLKNRDEFTEKFRRAFISALCKFCISRKQMGLARYRRDFVASVISYTTADIGVNLFCDKNGGGYLNNSLKSRRAYQKRRRETNWTESTPPSATNENPLSTLLRSIQHQSSLADLLRVESQKEEPDIHVFVRYRRVNEEWRDVDVRQSRLGLNFNASVGILISALIEKYSLSGEEDRLLLRIFDSDFGEFVDVEEYSIPIENLAKFELIHRSTTNSAATTSDCSSSSAKNNADSGRETPNSTRSCTPPSALANVLRNTETSTSLPQLDSFLLSAAQLIKTEINDSNNISPFIHALFQNTNKSNEMEFVFCFL